jgi:hypothetical protein
LALALAHLPLLLVIFKLLVVVEALDGRVAAAVRVVI